MMYVVKINDYYVKSVELTRISNIRAVTMGDILLSKEIMRNFDKNTADIIAKKIAAKVIEIPEEGTNEE